MTVSYLIVKPLVFHLSNIRWRWTIEKNLNINAHQILCNTYNQGIFSSHLIFKIFYLFQLEENYFTILWCFYHTSVWIGHRYTFVPPILNSPPTSFPTPSLQVVTESLLHCWWECKLTQLLWRTVCRFL